MEMFPEQHTSSASDAITIKQEPVEAEPHTSPKQEIEYISVKEEALCEQKWEEPDGHDSVQDPLSTATEECPPSEDVLGPVTYNIDKTENEGDEEEALTEEDGQELKHEAESTNSGSELGRTDFDVEDDNGTDDGESLVTKGVMPAGASNRIQNTTKQKVLCGNKIGTGHLTHKCGICKKTFTQSSSLKQYLGLYTGERLYSCGVCDKTFKTTAQPKIHSQLHTDESLYSCGVCNKIFVSNSQLKTCSRLHTGESLYTCGVCNKTFAQNANLNRHFILHNGERRYNCGACNKTFTQDTSLKYDPKHHTGEHSFSCGVCKKVF